MFSSRSGSSSIARCVAASALAVTLAVPVSGALAAQASGAAAGGAVAGGAVAGGAVAGGAVAAQAAQTPPPASAAARAAHVDLRSTALGKLLVDGSGFTLYVFSRDSRDKDRCAAIQGCAGVWPALTTHGRAVAGRGVKASWLGTIELPGGAHQVTYDGHPLYTYAFDSGPGATDYVGASEFGGLWRGLSASGKTVG